jgi:hypothetical protein
MLCVKILKPHLTSHKLTAMKPAYLIVIAIAFCTIISCQNSANDERPQQLAQLEKKSTVGETFGNAIPQAESTQDAAEPPRDKQKDTKQNQQRQPAQQAPVRVDWDKKIIKTGSLNAEVKDYHKYYASLREKVKALGGYIAQEEQNQSEYKIENSLVIKVPVDQFDNAIVQLSANTEKVNERKVNSQDVTMEMVDTKSRMEAKRQVRLRYMDLLKEAKTMQDILNVQSEINGVQEEIESAAGRIEYLGHASAFSTINLTYYQVLNVTAKDEQRPSFATRIGWAFMAGGSWLKELFIGLVAIWPLLFAAAVVIILVKKYSSKKVAKVGERKSREGDF